MNLALQYIIKGGGDEYKTHRRNQRHKATLIIPVSYPDANGVDDPFDAVRVSSLT